jgi:hypothetical protein
MVQVMGKFAPGEVVGFSLLSQGRPKNLSIRLAGQPGAATFPPSATVPAVPSGRMPLTPPSRNLTQFQGNGFALSIPDNWTSSVSPSGRTTYLSAPDGRRKPSRDITTLLLGMIVGFETASVADLTTAADKQVRAFVAENPELRVLEHRAARLGGHAAEFIRMENPSPFPGEREISWMYMTLEGNRVCFLTFTSPLAEFPSVKMAFEQMVATFRFLDN